MDGNNFSFFDYSRLDKIPILTAQEAADLDKFSIENKKIEARLLIAWAGYAAFLFLRAEEKFKRAQAVHLLTGKGNNGGDGFALAYHILTSTDKKINLWMNEPPVSKEANYFYRLCLTFQFGNRLQVNNLKKIKNKPISNAVIIEALFGNSFRGNLDNEIEKIFLWLKKQKKNYSLSLDIPAGVIANGDFFSHTAFTADATVAFGSARPAHLLEPGIFYCGHLHVMPIGFYPDEKFNLTRQMLAPSCWRAGRKPNSHKYSSGQLWVLGGSKGMEGAAVMCAYAFLKTGGGMARIFTTSNSLVSILETHPEIMVQQKNHIAELEEIFLQAISAGQKKQTVVIGVGLSESLSQNFWQKICGLKNISLLIDGGALRQLSCVAEILKKRKFSTLTLTPHSGEMQTLLGKQEKKITNMRVATLQAAQKYRAVVYAKGAGGIIAGENKNNMQEVYVNSKSYQLAVAGSGDILSGIGAGMLSRMDDGLQAMSVAVFFHLRAAEKVMEKIALQNKDCSAEKLRDFFVPTEILSHLPMLISETENECN